MQGEERKIVILGEHLRVQVKMSEDDTYGIFLRNLVAKGGTGTNNVTLIDRSGCPVEVKLMREDTQQIREVNPWKAIWRLLLPLEADVEMYLERCQPVRSFFKLVSRNAKGKGLFQIDFFFYSPTHGLESLKINIS
ncbi:uncharacterized protein LOC143244813 isoform X1 [Tachypleus tridentatus]|uniref:uncharacterized protein LOC143244813 isoform X1 n=1 Tax=Tachypleus tridentatus TaxID=6853 RepID=UPI003FD27AF0